MAASRPHPHIFHRYTRCSFSEASCKASLRHHLGSMPPLQGSGGAGGDAGPTGGDAAPHLPRFAGTRETQGAKPSTPPAPQNHRMIGVGRALCGSPSPAPCPSRVTHSRLHRTTSRRAPMTVTTAPSLENKFHGFYAASSLFMSHLKSLHLQNFLNNLCLVYKGGRGTRFAENQVTPNASQAATGGNRNRHRYSLGGKTPQYFYIYTSPCTLQRRPRHQRVLSKTSPSANEDYFQPSEFILFSDEGESPANQSRFSPHLHGEQKQGSCRTAPPPNPSRASLTCLHTRLTILTLLRPRRCQHRGCEGPSRAAGNRRPLLPRAAEGSSSPPRNRTAAPSEPPSTSPIHKELRPPHACLKEDVKRPAEDARGRKMREDIAKTSSNFGCRPPRRAKGRDARRAPRRGLAAPWLSPTSPSPPRQARSERGGDAGSKIRPPCPATGRQTAWRHQKSKSWVRKRAPSSLPGTGTRYHRPRLTAVPSQAPAAAKWEQHPARGSAAALHPCSDG